MMNYKPEYGDMELWLICTAIGSDHDLIDKMQKNPDGSYPVKFEIGGIELDFSKVAKRIGEVIDEIENNVDQKVKEKASQMLKERYESLLGEIYEIQERIENQKDNLFKYD